MTRQGTMKGVTVATAWTELKSQPVRQLAAKAFGAPQPEKYGEPMRDPELADILDQFELNVLALEVINPGKPALQGENLTGLIFRICESSRATELDGPPAAEINTAQLQQTVTLHEIALRKISEYTSNAKVLEWRKHISERRDSFAKELAGRAPNRVLTSLLDQFDRDIRELTSVRPQPDRTEEDERNLTGLVMRIREWGFGTGLLSRLSEVISTEQIARLVDLHKRAAALLDELMPAEQVSVTNQQIKERHGLFAGILRNRQPK